MSEWELFLLLSVTLEDEGDGDVEGVEKERADEVGGVVRKSWKKKERKEEKKVPIQLSRFDGLTFSETCPAQAH